MYELYDKTLGIVGLGNIGKKVARRAQAFGMKVEYYDIKRLTEDEEDALGVKFRLLRELLRRSDFVSLHVPLNASTKHMIGAAELALMKPTAILVNTSRGPVIDEKALPSLWRRTRSSAPASTSSTRSRRRPTIRCSSSNNVVLTAHFAGPTSDNHIARFRNAFDNVERMMRGDKPFWVVPELL